MLVLTIMRRKRLVWREMSCNLSVMSGTRSSEMNRRKVLPTHKLAEWRKRMRVPTSGPDAGAPALAASPEAAGSVAAAPADVAAVIEPA